MSANTSRRQNNRPRARNAPSRRRPARTAGDVVTVRRSEYIGPFPASDGAFVSAVVSAYPASPAVSGVTALYTEFRYSNYRLRIVPRSSTSTLGSTFLAILGSPPTGTPVSLEAAATLSRFQSRSAGHGPAYVVPVDTRVALRPWYLATPTPSEAQLLLPDYVPFWIVVGSNAVQSGVIPADLYATYTVQYRSSAPLQGSLTTSLVARISLIRGEPDQTE